MSTDARGQDFGLAVQSGRTRLTRHEVRCRVIEVATAALSETGVTVGLNHLNMEELIRRVGVPRSSAFAAFGGKDELITEVMVALLQPTDDPLLGFSPAVDEAVRATITRHGHRMLRADGSIDPVGRTSVLREVVRVAVEVNIADVAASTAWQTYLAVVLSSRGLDARRRARVEAAVRHAQDQFVETMATWYADHLPLVGRRPRPGVSWLLLATACAAVVEGMVGRRLAGSTVAATPVPGPGLDGEPVPWDPAALVFLGVIDTFTEDDLERGDDPGRTTGADSAGQPPSTASRRTGAITIDSSTTLPSRS